MASQPPAALAAAVKRDRTAPAEDSLERVRVILRTARDKDREVNDLETRLKEVKAQVLELKQKTLPDLYDEVGIDNLGLPAEGNLPAYDCKLENFYHANISADWEEEKRQAAFSYLDDLTVAEVIPGKKNKDGSPATRQVSANAGDLIKTTYTVLLPRGNRKKALDVEKALQKLGVDIVSKLEVPWNTLTAWVKEQVEKHNTTPNLEVLGATVGRVVKLKERKDK